VNCTVIQRRLLSLEQPEQPPAEIKSHLAQCPSCRTWQRRLVQMERQVPLLPIPPSTMKEQFVQRFLGTPSGESARRTIADPTTLSHYNLAPGPKERALRKVSLAFALAASLLVFALGWWSWPHHPPSPSGLAQHEQARLEERLTSSLRGDTPEERVLRLAQLVEELHGEAPSLVDNSEKLELWSQFYVRIVGEHLIEQARQLPAEDRPAIVEKVAQSLSNTESTASRFAAKLKNATPRSAASFDRIALASRKGERDLRALLKG
jgi:hypothetical protein